LLNGYCKIRITYPADGYGHAWLEYHNPQLLGEDGYYIVDPGLRIFYERDKLAQEYPTNDAMYKIFESNIPNESINYANYAQEMVRLNSKKSWFG